MATKEETTRVLLIRLIFTTISKVEHSFDDYEHLLRTKKQLLSQEKMVANTKDILDHTVMIDEESDYEDGAEELNTQNGDNGNIQVTIRTF